MIVWIAAKKLKKMAKKKTNLRIEKVRYIYVKIGSKHLLNTNTFLFTNFKINKN